MSEELLECQECSAQCEKVVYPAACLSMNCRFLYAFKEDGDTFFGCIEKVFPHEIDLKMFEDIERGKGGFGVVKVARQPAAAVLGGGAELLRHRRRPALPQHVLPAPRPARGADRRRLTDRRQTRVCGRNRGRAAVSPSLGAGILRERSHHGCPVGANRSRHGLYRGGSSRPRSGGLVKLPEQHYLPRIILSHSPPN